MQKPRRAFPILGGAARHAGIQLDMPATLSYYRSKGLSVFSGGLEEIGFILFLAFLLFGPKKLPEIARTLGKGMSELRRASNELKSSLEEEIVNLDRPAESEPAELPEAVPENGHDYSEPTLEETQPRT
jgi:TatA/E family protein of Tat protein translocase